MTWADLIPLIVRYGVPWTVEFWKVITEHPDPTDEAWDKISKIVNKTEAEYFAEARARAGLPPTPAEPS